MTAGASIRRRAGDERAAAEAIHRVPCGEGQRRCRRKHRDGRRHRADQPRDAISDERRADRHGPGRDLPQRDGVGERLGVEPSLIHHHHVLDRRDHREPSPERHDSDGNEDPDQARDRRRAPHEHEGNGDERHQPVESLAGRRPRGRRCVAGRQDRPDQRRPAREDGLGHQARREQQSAQHGEEHVPAGLQCRARRDRWLPRRRCRPSPRSCRRRRQTARRRADERVRGAAGNHQHGAGKQERARRDHAPAPPPTC